VTAAIKKKTMKNLTGKKYYWRDEHSTEEWFKIMKAHDEDLPEEFCDIFDRDQEIAEEYQEIMNSDYVAWD
jgi:hypothetical protein